MSVFFQNRLVMGVTLSAVLGLAGCGAPAPKDFGDTWVPVNRFQSVTTEIPIAPVYLFYASPTDLTLRTLLKRWATDSGLELDYQLGSDFTLILPVADIRTPDIQVAAKDLSNIYASQKLVVTVDDKRILVQRADAEPKSTQGS
ncbi:MAG TPA: hypothetical protein VF450_07965 [Noviherbaspirillum sp.]